VTYGFSKDKRHDLKQLVLNLATNNKADLPIHMAAHSGNASDHKTLIQAAARIEQFCSQLAEMPSFIYVADSAMYESCLKEGKKLMWLSRVPMQRKEAKRFIWDRKDHVQDVVGTEYQIHAEEKVVAGIKQRWLLVFSKQAYNRAVSTIEKNKAKEQVTASKKLRYLSKQVYNCQKDAEKTLKKFQKELKYHCITEIAFNAKKKYQNKGRPKEEDEMVAVGYQIKGVLVEDNTKIASLLTQKGYFILSTNQLDKNELSDEAILWEYKAQQKTERGFAFIKDNTFEVSSVFLKKPSRISALMMVMALSLFIYSLTQYWLRRALVDKHEFIPNQLKKPTQKPTAKWVFFLLRSIHVIYIRGPGHNQELVINLNPLLKRIIKYFGQETMSIYDIIPSTVE
jgi:transposase